MRRQPLRGRIVRAGSTCAALLILAGCQMTPAAREPGPIRAVWVTRFDYKTADDVRQIMQNCEDAGFNTVVWQVRGNGTTFYPSKIEPWAEQFDYMDPGFDPLALAVKEAHQRKMELHAWVNAVPAWRGTQPPKDPRHVYHTHPEWFWYDQQGKRQPLTWFYVSLNPCLPEVRAYVVSVCREIVANYPVDGLHLDYIRFPNEPPAIPAGSGIDYPRDERTLALYKEATGKAPEDDEESWNRWRTDQVTQLVRDLHAMMRSTRPRAVLAASVGATRRESNPHFRDDLRWGQEKIIDEMYPMNYKADLPSFEEGLDAWREIKDIPVVPGLWFAPRLSTEEGINIVKQQIQSSIAATGNFCLFAYASLFDANDADRMVNPAEQQRRDEARQQREVRRRELLPFLRSLAGKPDPVALGQ